MCAQHCLVGIKLFVGILVLLVYLDIGKDRGIVKPTMNASVIGLTEAYDVRTRTDLRATCGLSCQCHSVQL
jgi:hypothetical protein